MPDLLAHYIASLLVASRLLRRRDALLVALAGLLPDIDAILGWHRSPTHSLAAILVFTSTCYILYRVLGWKFLRIAPLLYALHIAMDVLNAPAPLLWPFTSQAYMLKVGISAVICDHMLSFKPLVVLHVEKTAEQAYTTTGGPIVSTTGAILALVAFTLYITGLPREHGR